MLAYRAKTECHEDIAIKRNLKVARKCQEVGGQPREGRTEIGCVGCKVCEGAHANDAVWVVAEYIRAVRRKVGALFGGGRTQMMMKKA